MKGQDLEAPVYPAPSAVGFFKGSYQESKVLG